MHMRTALVLLLAVSACEKGAKPPPSPEPVVSVAPTPTPDAAPVAPGTVRLSIAIETIGGVSSVIIPRGTALPFTKSETFSTAADDQTSVEVHVLQGERPMARDNRTLGKFQLVGIPPARRGVPQIDVTFALDAAGALTVSARDRATANDREIHIEGRLSAANDLAEVERLLADPEQRAADALTQKRIAAQTDLASLVTGAQRIPLDKLPKAQRERLSRALADATALQASPWNATELPAVQRATEALREASHAASALLYQ